jgi:nucleoid-associated protein YgaU
MLRITTADGRYQVLTTDRFPVELIERDGQRLVAWLGLTPDSGQPQPGAPPAIVSEEGTIALVGAAPPGRRVAITFDGRQVENAADDVGGWRVELGGNLAVGEHQLTIVEHDAATGAVVARADLALIVEAGGGVELAVDLTPIGAPEPAAPRTAVVGPNDTLWDLAVRFYGDGTRYFDIYQANRREIGASPRRIYPGQVLLIP